jgi:RimJ/RimL family protein N-acetyltransferase
MTLRLMGVSILLSTERLVLRPHALADFPPLAALWADPEVVRYISGKPATTEEVWARLLRYAGHWALKGFGFWAAFTKDAGAFIGELGFMEFKRELEPSFGDAPEMGWSLSPAFQGRGYALEAGRAALAWADAHFGRVRIVCLIAPENAPSIRLAEKLGFRESGRAAYKGEPAIQFERLPGP